MKRENGSGSIRKRPDGTYEARYTAGINLGTGKQIRKSIYGKNKDELAARLRKITASIDSGDYMEPSKLTVKQWFEIWLEEYSSDKKPLTVQQYKSMAETHIFPALGAVKLSKLTSPQLQKFYNRLAVDGKMKKRKNPETGKMEAVKSGEPLSAKTIQNIHAIISKCLNTAIQQGIIKDNPASRTTLPKVIHEEVKPLTEEQQQAFIKAIQNHKYRVLYTVILFTGLREGEALGLTWDCINFKTGMLKVYRQLQRVPGEWNNFRFVPLKNNKARYIRLSDYILDILEKHKKQQRLDRLAAGENWQSFQTVEEQETALVFTDSQGCNLNPAPVYENFKKIAADIGAPEARVHDLRHTFAVNSLQCGDDIKTVQSNLGHATAAFTLDRYGHVSERMREESAKRQQEYIKRLGIQA